MSDDDFMIESDQEGYDFEYEDEGEEESGDVDVENKYYNAKQMKPSDPRGAIDEFLGVVGLEKEKGDWGFKGLKQAIKLEFKLKKHDRAVEHFEELLTYIRSAVTRNYSEKSLNNMLDYISSSNDEDDMPYMERFYDMTLAAFQGTNNERLCEAIQMYSETGNNKKMKELYNQSLRVRSAVPHPRIMGIIRECGGKMHMNEENWKEAQSDFFEAFRNYDEAGSIQRIQVLKYLVLASMLMKSEINPFESQETKPYKSDPRIQAMTDLVEAYQRNEIHRYESILETHKAEILSDPFIREHIDEVTRNIRTEALLKLIAPFTRFTLDFIARQLKIHVAEVQEILGFLILDKKIRGKINQQKGTIEVEVNVDAERMKAMKDWSAALGALSYSLFNDGDGFKSDDASLMGGMDVGRRRM
ncbi:unnamed protein product [Tuber melanosporum]|uniref:(Perigord truffle) hypothetical protein n=1 Tax=Tuber melanosporum (strain Mel28) TaxID=656061 RepID=D5GHC7_TUBMM|nr:uncharacterized protein GSTUM_00007755001 [Tuber melanosporum]CAZ83879.1 unnamed protein product [Tuber melanosporum]